MMWIEGGMTMTIQRNIPSFSEADKVTGCCPVFHPEAYDNQSFDFSEYHFIKASSLCFMHIPLNLGSVMTKTQAAIDKAHQGYTDRYLILSEDVSPFKTQHYFLVKGKVEGYALETLKGEYYAKVYDGPFKDISKWIHSYIAYFEENKMKVDRLLLFYTTCPNCAKTYGHNYVVIFGKTV